MKRVGPLLLLLLLCGMVGRAQELPPLTVPDLPDLEVRRVERARQESLRMGNLPPVERRGVPYRENPPLRMSELPTPERRGITPPERQPFQVSPFPQIEHRRIVAPEASNFIGPQLPKVELLAVAEFKDFKGGLNLSSYKTKLAPNQSTYLMNALWNEQGEMYKRPGFDTLVATPEEFNFLYRYYQQDDDKYLMGGSDTALYFWQKDSSDWTWLAGTEGTSGRWDGTTFEDMFVGTHEGIEPIVWDGTAFIEMGVSVDSFQVIGLQLWSGDSTDATCTVVDSFKLKFDPTLTGWTANEWEGYTLGYWAFYYTGPPGNGTDTVFAKAIIRGNTDSDITLYGFYDAASVLWNSGGNYYAKIYSWFGVDSVWREGKAGIVERCQFTSNPYSHGAKITDSSFYWDSTITYNDYIFEVISGTGEGKICFLRNHQRDLDCGDGGWDSTAFVVPAYHHSCFDTSTYYRIYVPSFTGRGAKFVENFDGRLWLGWTGSGVEQNKNQVLYSGISDLGNWPVEQEKWIESDDGDYITGMFQFYPDQQGHRNEPWAELVVSKEQSLYRVYPTTYGGALGYNTMFISQGVGCCSNLAMQMIEGKYVAFPDQHGVWLYNGTGVQPISLLIDPIFESWDISNLEYASAIYNPQDRHYYLSFPTSVDDAVGEFFVSFPMDSADEGSRTGMWNHTISSAGLRSANDVLDRSYSSNFHDVAIDVEGNYALIWKLAYSSHYNLFLTRFDSDGDSVGSSIQLNDTDDDVEAGEVSVEMNNSGQIVSCWTSEEDGTDDIRCQAAHFDSSGAAVKVDTNYYANDNAETNVGTLYDFGAVDMNEDGVIIVVWEDYRDSDSADFEIFGQLYEWPNVASGSNFRVNNCWSFDGVTPGICDTCAGDQPTKGGSGQCLDADKDVDVAASERHFVATWISERDGGAAGTWNIWKRLFLIDGTPVNAVMSQVDDDPAAATMNEPEVTINASGRHVVTWNYATGGGNYDVYMRQYEATGEAKAVCQQVNTDAGNSHTDYAPAAAINNNDVFVIAWLDNREATPSVYWRAYTWGGAIAEDSLLHSADGDAGEPEIDVQYRTEVADSTLAYNIDDHGWSWQSFSASAYCYQHGLTDTVKVIFAEDENRSIQNYDVQADDEDNPVILTYQSPYMSFTEYPYWENFLRYVTIEAYLDTGTIYLDFYKDYSTLVHQDSIMCGTDCRQEIQLPDSLYGKNLSMKVRTGSEIETFYLPRYWWEYNVKKERD